MMSLQHGPGYLRIVGRIPQTANHAHYALQLSIGLGAPLFLAGEEVRNVLLDANHEHALRGDDCLTLLIEPTSHAGALLHSTYLSSEPVRHNLPLSATRDASWSDIIEALATDACTARHLDPRIAATLAWFDEEALEGRWSTVTLAEACRRASLSESRFLHLFREQAGIAWRPALVWRRALVALESALRGHSLTTAAHEAGYSDSAHLSRQVKALFGLSPSAVVKNSQIIQAQS